VTASGKYLVEASLDEKHLVTIPFQVERDATPEESELTAER
jgi:hypothetical protein